MEVGYPERRWSVIMNSIGGWCVGRNYFYMNQFGRKGFGIGVGSQDEVSMEDKQMEGGVWLLGSYFVARDVMSC